MQKYFLNSETDVCFIGTPRLVKDHKKMKLMEISEEEYRKRTGTVAQPAQAPASEPIQDGDLDPNQLTLVVDAIARMDLNDKENFNSDGVTLDAKKLSSLVGFVVNKEMRNKAWEVYSTQE